MYLIYFSRVAFFPLTIGDHVFVGERSIVNASVVGSYVYIGKNVVIVKKQKYNLHKIIISYLFLG